VVVFDPDAQQHREDVDRVAQGYGMLADTSRRLKSAFGKWAGMYARLALTFHLIDIADAIARNETGPVRDIIATETAKRAADYMLDIVLPHLLRADALMFSTAQTNHAERVAGFIILHGQELITARDIVRGYKPFAGSEATKDLDAVMSHLALLGWVKPIFPDNHSLPVRKGNVNPAVFNMFPDRAEKERKRRADAVTALKAIDAKRSAKS